MGTASLEENHIFRKDDIYREDDAISKDVLSIKRRVAFSH